MAWAFPGCKPQAQRDSELRRATRFSAIPSLAGSTIKNRPPTLCCRCMSRVGETPSLRNAACRRAARRSVTPRTASLTHRCRSTIKTVTTHPDTSLRAQGRETPPHRFALPRPAPLRCAAHRDAKQCHRLPVQRSRTGHYSPTE